MADHEETLRLIAGRPALGTWPGQRGEVRAALLAGADGIAVARMILDYWSSEDPARMGKGQRAIWDAARKATGGEP